MNRYRITNVISGHVLGEHNAFTEEGALDALAQEAGYRDYDALQAEGCAEPGEIKVEEVPS